MNITDLGAPVKSIWTGAPVGGTYAVSVTRPDGTAFTPAPTPSATAPVSVEFTPDMAGRWLVRWTSTVVVGAYTDVLSVFPTDPRFIISLDMARATLQLPPNTAANILDDLRLYIAAATPVIEDIVGPVIVRTETQTVNRYWSYAALNQRPASTITSVIGADATVYVAGTHYDFDPNGGLVTFRSPTSQSVTITYTVGTAIVPPNVQLAARELVRHWYNIGAQGARTAAPTPETWTPSGFAVPRRVMELCAPSQRVDGFA